ncbi:regulatory protein GemA [Pandoraea fibrosis]|uniref:Regulatory protein GemA n=1 Tax=Pandoraea fibrosis TaxID=1891094 RepID=A0A5E4XGT1_9BURK|nr:regulatory protein GemA [Pandoraea fibrosis]VVE35476.1 hypothetical protein PFI31113_03839 [Pandoraea fibrosis]
MADTQTRKTREKKMCVLIQIVRRNAQMEEPEYRALLIAVTGKARTRQMNCMEMGKVLDRLAEMGFPSEAKLAFERVGKDRRAMLSKIDAQLRAQGRPRTYLDSMVKQICKVDALEFCTPEMLNKLIAALAYDAQRHQQ